MKHLQFYVCPICGNVLFAAQSASIACCGRTLEALEPRKAPPEEQLRVQSIEDEWLITSPHPMTKEHHIAFVAMATGERVQLVRQYPEWDLQLRLSRQGFAHGKLFWYCTQHGLSYQLM